MPEIGRGVRADRPLETESAAARNLKMGIWDGATGPVDVVSNQGDALGGRKALITNPQLFLFNETNWDRLRANTEIILAASAARTASGATSIYTNYNARGCYLILDITAVSGTFAAGEGLKARLEAYDPNTGRVLIIAPWIGPFTTVGTWVELVYPGATDAAGVIEGENDVPLPRSFKAAWTITGTTPSFTFSLTALLIL